MMDNPFNLGVQYPRLWKPSNGLCIRPGALGCCTEHFIQKIDEDWL